MKSNRKLKIGRHVFDVPPRIQRVPGGWQVRYAGTLLFSDGEPGPRASFAAAVAELQSRYAASPPKAASSVRVAPLSHKTTDLPAGISGPVLIHKPGRAAYAEFKVTLPRAGKPNRGTSVYIASESTWSQERYDNALDKALRLRVAALAALPGYAFPEAA